MIAAHWVWEGATPLFPRDELILAALAHDAGWVGVERRIKLNQRGWPRTFTEMPLSDHFAIWEASIEAVVMQNRYAGLLTSKHCTALYEHRLRHIDDPPTDRTRIQDFLYKWYTWQDDLRAALTNHPYYAPAVQPDRLAENVRLLQVWDYLSLLLCVSPVHEQPLDDVPLQAGGRGILWLAADGLRDMTLDPFPLDKPLTLYVDARLIDGGPFVTNAAFWHWLADVPYEPLVFELRPPG